MSKYKALFLNESHDRLAAMNQLILELEKDPANSDVLSELFRSAHSIKGMAASMGFTLVAGISHKLEDLLGILRDGEREVTSTIIDILLEGRDHLESLTQMIEKDESLEDMKTPVDHLIAKIIEFEKSETKNKSEKNSTTPSLSSMIREEEVKATRIKINISPKSNIPSARGFLIHRKLSDNFKIINCIPSLEQIKRGEFDQEFEIRLEGHKNREDIQKVLAKVTDLEGFKILDESPKKTGAEKPSLDGLKGMGLDEFIRPKKKVTPVVSASASSGKVRVTTEFLDNLIDSMGEVLIHGLQNEDFIRKLNTSLDLNFSAREMVKKLRGIYENVLQVRMNPLNLITDKLPRTVRDLARQTGKIIQIEMSGTDILMDRSILEELDSPLLHIIRNCIDHGIETPQERKKAGKPERGTISLRTQLDQGLVEIEIRDDGKGLNPQKIREKAIEKKILTPEQSGILTDEDIFMLICSPGFSTHTQVTDISGRGVGMDVVKNMVESYDGFLDIQSVLHEGTKFTIRLPVTVSIVNVLLFKVEKQTYAFPISRIDRTVEIPKEKIQKQQGKDVFIYEDQMVPLINLNHLLGFETSDGNNKGYPVVLVERRGKQFGIRVSSLLGQEEVVLKPLSKALKEIEIIFGATILANGRPTFILDVNKIIQMV